MAVRTPLYVAGCMFHCKGLLQCCTWSLSMQAFPTKVRRANHVRFGSTSMSRAWPCLGERLTPASALVKAWERIAWQEISGQWTGYGKNDVGDPWQLELLSLIDILVDGRHDETSATSVPDITMTDHWFRNPLKKEKSSSGTSSMTVKKVLTQVNEMIFWDLQKKPGLVFLILS